MRGIYIIHEKDGKVTGHTIHYKSGRPVVLKFTNCTFEKVHENARRVIEDPFIYRFTNQ